MNEVMVTARLPPSLVEALRRYAHENHYMDLSELIRAVLRKKFEEFAQANPKSIEDSIIKDIKLHTLSSSESLLSGELLRLKKRLREELK